MQRFVWELVINGYRFELTIVRPYILSNSVGEQGDYGAGEVPSKFDTKWK